MAITKEIEYVSGILEHATTHRTLRVFGREPQYVATIGKGVDLVAGSFSYRRRIIVGGQRLLTPNSTTQPVLGIRINDEVTAIPYAEDVINHPLKEGVVRALEMLYLTGE